MGTKMTIRWAQRITAPWFWVVAAMAVLALLTGSTASGGSWHDDFEDGGSDDWVVFNFNPESESWDEKGGFVVGEINRPGFFSVLQLKPRRPGDVNPDEWSNYTVKVKMRLESKPQDDQDTGFGLILYDHLDQLQYHLIRLQYHQSNILARIDTGEINRPRNRPVQCGMGSVV